MSFKFQQVLRTNKRLTAENGTVIESGTRVVVMDKSVNTETNQVRVKVDDPSFPDLRKVRVVAGIDAFDTTQRGRPTGSDEEQPTEE